MRAANHRYDLVLYAARLFNEPCQLLLAVWEMQSLLAVWEWSLDGTDFVVANVFIDQIKSYDIVFKQTEWQFGGMMLETLLKH